MEEEAPAPTGENLLDTPDKLRTALKPIASTEAQRFPLTGIYIDGENQTAVATDGRVMVVVPYSDAGGTRLIGTKKKEEDTPGIAYVNYQLVLQQATPQNFLAAEDLKAKLANLPKRPKKKLQETITEATGSLLDVYLYRPALEALAKSGAVSVEIGVVSNLNDPVYVKADNGVVAVIMPMRPAAAQPTSEVSLSEAWSKAELWKPEVLARDLKKFGGEAAWIR